ncbi:calcium-translocating P-type ATPase [Colletotrichum scovillei]|uniref:calcium-translocating P-type ATPase n=1 Tax=Colletotrichum scovillei TaxID=1209932 RepID=UPI0015C363B4|nr:calcium-translocating P-type ATPase [Colletotrichum scovillei]KAF4779183.1 calcium-translocating P-type ATPase [Colletotrichum scovillei]
MSPLEGTFGRTPKVDLPDKVEGFIRTQSYEPGNSESNRSGRIVDGRNASSADCKSIIGHNDEDPSKRPILHDVEQSPASTMTMDPFPLVTGVWPVPISLSISQCEKDFQHITASPGQLNQMYNPKNLMAFYYRGGIQRIANGLKTDLRFGLSDGCVNIQSPVSSHEAVGKVKRSLGQGNIDLDDFECRKRVLGGNRLSPPKETPLLKLMRMASSDKVLIPVTVLVTAVGEHSNIGRTLMSMRDDESPGMGALAWFMFMASQLGNFLCVTLSLGTNLLPEISTRMNCCNFGLLSVPVLNLVRFCTNMFQSEAVLNTDAVKPSFFRLHTKIDHYTSFRLDQSLATTFQEGAITEPHRLSTLADSLRFGSASTATEWTGIISQPIGSSTARRHRRLFVNNPRLAGGICLAGYVIPLAAAAFRVARGLRIASGLTSTVSGVTVIPLRTAEGFPVWSWILTYGVWATAFSVYLWQQTRRIPRNANHRRQLYLFCVIMAAGHFTTAMSQASGAPPLPDIFTLYGPIILTFCAYSFFLVYEAVLHEVPKGGEPLDREASPTPDGDSAATVPFGAQPDQTALGIGVAAMAGVPSEVALS